MLESVTECYEVLQSVTECYRVLQSVTVCYRVLQSVTEYYRVLQSITNYYRVLRVLQCFSSASTWTNFWACFCCFDVERKKNGTEICAVDSKLRELRYLSRFLLHPAFKAR